jgi:hypothetical protein
MTLFPFLPLRAWPAAYADNLPRRLHLFEQAAQVVAADSGAEAFQVSDREIAGDALKRLPQQLGLCTARRFDLEDSTLCTSAVSRSAFSSCGAWRV